MTPWHQRQWLAVARLSGELAAKPGSDFATEVSAPIPVAIDAGITIPGGAGELQDPSTPRRHGPVPISRHGPAAEPFTHWRRP
jgi:hypothetical protein